MTSQRSRANAPRAGKHGRKRINLKKFLIRVAVDKKILHSQHVKKKNQCALKSPLPRHFSKKSYSLKKPIVLLASSACFCLLPLRSLSPSFPLILFPSTIHTLVELVMIGSFEKPKIIRSSFRELSGKALLHSYIERNRSFSVTATQGKKCSMYRYSINVNYIQIAFTLSLFNAWHVSFNT